MYGAITRLALMAHAVTGWLAARDVRLVPGHDVEWRPPVDAGEFVEWIHLVRDRLGGTIKSWVVQLPRDRRRRRFNLLFLDEARIPVAFAKLTANPTNPIAIRVLAEFSRKQPKEFWAPGLLMDGHLENYSYVVTTPMPNLPHRPAHLGWEARHRLVAEFQAMLGHLIDPSLVLVHGDFGPWNVRSMPDDRIAVVDWEEATQGVDAADELWHSVAVHTLRTSVASAVSRVWEEMSHHSPSTVDIAARFWLNRLARPQPDEVDQSIGMPARLYSASARIEEVLKSLVADGGR